ncbi:T9SS type A sorting domain-containing protein [Flammeovirgaceae bacterium SG7u.111]|nr:T9SS type A sorting domain-containing protein [Flammeovirgaceae bacterium SG7u.132]WPO35113.1 T9SS type A sorting domain-containing protein [Flammeovirgaceae bacterium SG7u.111]
MMNAFKHCLYTFFILVTLSCGSQVFAQLNISPIPKAGQKENIEYKRSVVPIPDTVFVNLPFFDDFSGYEGDADTLRWSQIGLGAYINNHYSEEAPSKGVATFDGVDEYGVPYDLDDEFNYDEADSLVSHFFDLSTFKPSDSLYITFQWQPEAFGEAPESEDSLRLQFADTSGVWQTVWSVNGDTTKPFATVQVSVDNEAFFHQYFRFRFQNIARLSGIYDAFHLDYVYFFKKEDDISERRLDVALVKQPTPALSRYTAMPLWQFLADPANETADTIFSNIKNLSDTFNVVSHVTSIKDVFSGQDFGNLVTGSSRGNASFTGTSIIFAFEELTLKAVNDLSFVTDSYDSLKLEYTYQLGTNETNELINTRDNDTLRSVTALHNYYAYDDGTAEYAIGVFQRFGKVAYKFEQNEPAQLTHIDMYLTQIGDNLLGQTFNLYVWQSIDTAEVDNDNVRFMQNIPLVYPSRLNEFRRIELAQPVYLDEGDFYIGFEQVSEENITIGYDKNTVSGENIYYNLGGKWIQNNSFPGSMLLRPVFSQADPNGLEEVELETTVYPNPATNILNIEGEVLQARIIDLSGRTLQSASFLLSEKKQFDVSTLPAGLYLLEMLGRNSKSVKKIIVQK